MARIGHYYRPHCSHSDNISAQEQRTVVKRGSLDITQELGLFQMHRREALMFVLFGTPLLRI